MSENKENKYCVVESNDLFIVCHGSGLSWAEAHLFVMSQMLNDINSTEKDDALHNVKMYELEANEPGLGVTYEHDGNKTTYYILDDPGRL